MKIRMITPKTSFYLVLLLAFFFPLGAMAGCSIDFSEFGLKDSIPSKLLLQKDNIIVSFEKENCIFNSEQNNFSFSKGATIMVKSKNGEKITGVRLLALRKESKDNSKKRKPELFSCDNGIFENGIWKGSSDAVTFQSIENCNITGIQATFSSDQKEAYVTKDYFDYKNGYDWCDGFILYFHYDGNREFYEEEYPFCREIFNIDDNSEYPEWYGVNCDIISFDSSFVDYHPKRTSHWFDGQSCEIENIEFLNTSDVKDMSFMFANFCYTRLDRGIDKDVIIDDEAVIYYDEDKYVNYDELFFSSIFEKFDFSNVLDMNHMFSGCNMTVFNISSPYIPSNADLNGIFENSKIEFISIDSSSINLRNDFFEGVGLGIGVRPCTIEAPEDFYFGVDTSSETFLWKGGRFKGVSLQAYVAVNIKSKYHNSFGYIYYDNNYDLTFYYDKNRSHREKFRYSYGGYSHQMDHRSYYGESERTYTYSISEWEDNKPSFLFNEAYDPWDNETENNLTTTIRFDESFAQYRPKSTRSWFELTRYIGAVTYKWDIGAYVLISGVGTAVKKIEGLEYLNTSEVTNTERMFYGLCCLDSLDLSHLDFSKVTNSKDMFGACYSLIDLNVNSTLNLQQDTYIDENGNCAYYIMYEDNIIFFFDDKINERNGRYLNDDERLNIVEINGPNCYLSWNSYDGKHVIIDPSFAQRPAERTAGWFYNNTSLESVQGLEYLHSTDMNCMFYGCSSLQSIDLWKCDMSMTENTDYMFVNCKNLSEITIPNTCKVIGDSAFYDCSKLSSITIPSSVMSIGEYAFYDCSKLSSITIPNSVTRISDCAFQNCLNISSVTIGKSVASIGWNAFYGCTGLTKVNIKDIAAWCGISFSYYSPYYGNNSYCSNPLFYAHNLYLNDELIQNLIIPDGVTSISNYAFYDCTSLTSVTIPNSVTKIGVSAFAGCTNLPVEGGVRYADTYLVTVVDKTQSTYRIKEGTRFIGESAFNGCSNMSSIAIPNSVTSIGYRAFYNCSKLTSVTVYNPIPVPFSTYSETFSNRKNATLYVPYGSKSAYLAAEHWKEFKKIIELPSDIITFADSKTKSICIGKWDSNGDGELSESEAAAVTSLGTTFKKSQITSFNELQYFTGLTSISDGAFSKSTVKELTLPENITSLGKEAFLDCKSLTRINIPAKVQTIGQNALSGCTVMTSITVDEGNTAFCAIDGVLFSKDKITLIQFPAAKTAEYTVPEGIKTIGRDAFYMSYLQSLTLSSTLEELGFDAFGYSKSLVELTIPEGVTTIGDYILDGCSGIKTLHIPRTVTTIGERMCNGCNALTDVICEIASPFAIASNNFTTTAYNNATLHVPASAKDAYTETEGWKNFTNIVGDLASNTLLADALTINLGKSSNLNINLSNGSEIDGVQFDITLPEGLTVSTDEDGDYEVSTTTRTKKLNANCTKLNNGSFRFILFSTDRAIIEPGEGAIMEINIACSDDAIPGNYEMVFSGISLSCVSGNVSVDQNCDDFTSPVTIRKVSDIRGDANGDFSIDVTDVMEIVNYILEYSSRTFVFDNADVDHNGKVNITDVMNVVNLILGNAIAPAPANAKAMPHDLLRITPEDGGCILHTTFHTQGITAMQMTISLPDGSQINSATLTGEASRTHKVMTKRIDDYRYNVVVFSPSGTTLDTDCPLLELGITGRGGMVNIENILCTNIDLETLLSNDISTVLTDISSIIADGESGNSHQPIYNTIGQQIDKPQRGINISRGRKMVVK